MKMMLIATVILAPGKLGRNTRRNGNKRKNWDSPDYGIVEIDHNNSEVSKKPKTCCHSDTNERPPANANLKKSPEINKKRRDETK